MARAKVTIFRDPLGETADYKLSEFYDPEALSEDTKFEIYRLGSRPVRAFIGERARAEPDSLWGRWYRGELREVECAFCKAYEEGEDECAACNGTKKATELQALGIDDTAALLAHATKRANPLRVTAESENGGDPQVELWDTNDHPEDRAELLEEFYGSVPDLTFMLYVRMWEAQFTYAKKYEATRKNSPASSPPRRKRGAKSAKKRGD